MSKQQESDEIGILGNLFVGVSTAKILDFLMSYREFDYSEADIGRYSKVSTRQVYRSLRTLEALGLVYQTRVSGRSKMYKLQTHSEAVHHLEKLVFELGKSGDIQIQDTLDNEEKEELMVT